MRLVRGTKTTAQERVTGREELPATLAEQRFRFPASEETHVTSCHTGDAGSHRKRNRPVGADRPGVAVAS